MSDLKNSGAGWLGRVPRDWEVAPIGRFARFHNGFDYSDVEVLDGGFPVYGSGGEFRRASQYLYDGQSVLFGRKGTIDKPLYVEGKFWTVDTMYYTSFGERLLARFAYYWAQTLPFGRWVTSTALPSMTQSDLKRIQIALPTLPEQHAVIDFLDRETAEIDAFIADQEKLIELLTERRAAAWQKLIDEAVPPLLPLRRVIKSIVDGPFGSSLSSKHYSDSGTRVIRLGNVGINEFKREDEAYIPSDYGAELSAHQAVTGDVIVAGLGDDRMPLGRAAVVPEIGPAIVKADCFRVRPNELTTGPYLAWALSSPGVGSRMRTASRGSTRQRLNTTVVREILVPVPDLEMQSLLLARSRATTAQLDETIAEARQAIALSKERRAALISAAVTGKIDVREHGRVNA